MMSAAPHGWEYEWFVMSNNENADRLNEWGAAGWEAVAVLDKPEWNTMMVLMKRARAYRIGLRDRGLIKSISSCFTRVVFTFPL